jgi:uncharacterized lipoprotein YbaY
MRSLPRVAMAAGLGSALGLAPGCASNSADGPPAPKSITAAQVEQMPLEQSGDLSARQNLAEPLPLGTLGKANSPRRTPR